MGEGVWLTGVGAQPRHGAARTLERCHFCKKAVPFRRAPRCCSAASRAEACHRHRDGLCVGEPVCCERESPSVKFCSADNDWGGGPNSW